uniref:Alpha 1,4-glycosyltransferase domain-containing protein n=1 Tax=Glossina brevipalpis TaxID=37001 RepID=A0A1A9WK41_9MUSC
MSFVLKFQKVAAKFIKISFRLKIMFSLLVILALIGLMFNIYYTPDMRYCFVDTLAAQVEDLRVKPKKLEDILLADALPPPSRSIFFHETSCPSTIKSITKKLPTAEPHMENYVNYVKLTARQACSIESAAFHNAKTNIYVLYASPRYQLSNISTDPILNAISSYKNVYFRNLNMWTYAATTPMYEWLKDGELFKSSYVFSHTSDFLRYLTLWRWGGTYLDMDTIMLRSIEDMPANFVGAESGHALAAGVMNFAKEGFGHEIAELCLSDFERNFKGDNWGNNGPGVITRVMSKVCDTEKIALMYDQKRCKGFHVFDQNAFYAIPWTEWREFFETEKVEKTLGRTSRSYIAHFWNKKSMDFPLKIGTKNAFTIMAENNCPNVYKAVVDHFSYF